MATATARVTVDWLALVACGLLIFGAGIVAGTALLRLELRRNGWRVKIRVDERDTTRTPRDGSPG